MIILLARWLREHPDCTPEEAVAKVEELSHACKMGFFPGDLAYLRAGGRVSNAAYLGAKILSLNPLIELQDGYLKATKKYRGKMEKVAPRLLEEFSAQYSLKRDILAFVYSKGISKALHDEMTALAKEMGFREILWIRTGGVVTTHCGPGGFGVCGMSRN